MILDPIAFARLASKGKYQSPPHIRLLQRFVLKILSTPGPARGIIQLPIRHGKSLYLSQYLPAWLMMAKPDTRLIMTGYSSSFATEWAAKARDLFRDYAPWLTGASLKPTMRRNALWAVDGHQGEVRAAGSFGQISGATADCLLSDDSIKGQEEANSPVWRDKLWNWWGSDAYSRLEPDGKCLIVLSRRHEDDLVGRLLRAADEGGDVWQLLRLPCLAGPDDPLGRAVGDPLWAQRFPAERLAAIRDDLVAKGLEHIWETLWQQHPTGDPASREWPVEYFTDVLISERYFDPSASIRLLSLDPSKGQDKKHGCFACYVDGTVDATGALTILPHLLKIDTEALEDYGVALVEQALQESRPYNAIACEGNGMQDIIARNIALKCASKGIPCPIEPLTNTTNKDFRIKASLTPLLSQRRLKILPGRDSKLFLAQMRQFPTATFKDGPDALELLIQLWNKYISGRSKPRDRVARVR